MTKLEKIEKAVSALNAVEVKQFAAWFAEFHADLWDKKIVADYDAGHLDKLLSDARAEIATGKLREL
jgi:hypothetical protein